MVCCVALGFSAGLASASAGALTSPGVAASATDGPTVDMQAARAFVLVVVGADDHLKRSEAYGDWQSHLQSFIARRRGGLPVHQVTPARARMLLPTWPREVRNATLFAHPQGRGLLHRGLVLEPQVYLIGKAFAEGGLLAPEAASFGLELFNWK